MCVCAFSAQANQLFWFRLYSLKCIWFILSLPHLLHHCSHIQYRITLSICVYPPVCLFISKLQFSRTGTYFTKKKKQSSNFKVRKQIITLLCTIILVFLFCSKAKHDLMLKTTADNSYKYAYVQYTSESIYVNILFSNYQSLMQIKFKCVEKMMEMSRLKNIYRAKMGCLKSDWIEQIWRTFHTHTANAVNTRWQYPIPYAEHRKSKHFPQYLLYSFFYCFILPFLHRATLRYTSCDNEQ